jgi:hypothetical protein
MYNLCHDKNFVKPYKKEVIKKMVSKYERIITYNGNSLCVNLPTEILKELQLIKGDSIFVYKHNNKIVIDKKEGVLNGNKQQK